MKKLTRSKIVPSLVRVAEETTAYPGYRYVYFKSFEELDEYFRATCGDDWLEQEWAKFWLRDHWKSAKQESRDQNTQPSTLRKTEKTTSKVPRHILIALMSHYQSQGMSLRQIADTLRDVDGIQVSHVMVSYLLKQLQAD